MSAHTIEVRNLRFPLGAEVPKHWFGETQSCSTFWDNLSVLFPAGERFFMNSVRAFENVIKDPKLKQEVRLFYQQEALHSREHVRYNDMVRAHGYPVDEMDKSVRKLLENVAKLPEEYQLAVTCALEHFTAMLAQGVLGEDSPFEAAHPVMGALWRWHAAEENEHASVAFDVYREVGGNYPVRVVVMAVATLIFWGKVIEQQVRMMHADGTLTSRSEWGALGRFLFKKPGWLFKMAGPYLAYFKPSFHPSELDCSHLLSRWQEEFEALGIYRESLRPPPKLAAAS
jgi:predicted metal-dependent hydrolase